MSHKLFESTLSIIAKNLDFVFQQHAKVYKMDVYTFGLSIYNTFHSVMLTILPLSLIIYILAEGLHDVRINILIFVNRLFYSLFTTTLAEKYMK